jgi:hypothetical protein
MRIPATALGVALAAAVAAQAPDARAEEGTAWYAERISTGDAPVRVEHFWSKGSGLRSETVFAGHPILTLVKGPRYVIVDRLTGQGISIERSPKALAEDGERERPFGNELHVLLESGGEKVGSQEVPGGRCDLYRLTNESGRKEVCVSPDDRRLPLVLRVWLRGSGQSMESRYLQWSREIEVPDAFFQPPANAALEHVTYEQYVERSPRERLGPAPPFHAELLHGY